MKIMTAMYTLKKGGFYDRFVMMIEAFIQRHCEVHCLSLTPIQIKHSYFHNHIIYFPFKTVNGFIAKLMVLFLFPLWSVWIAWSHKIDLVIAFGSLYAFIQGFSKWFVRRPMVTFIRGNSYFGLAMQDSRKYFLRLNKIPDYLGLLFSDRIITNNTATEGEILRRLRKRRNIDVQVLYNNIPSTEISVSESISQTRAKYGIPQDGRVLVTAGILNRGKNVDILIKCLPKIGLKNLFLVVIGEGSTEADFRYRAHLKELAEALRVSAQVLFTGWLEKGELRKLYPAADLFILPSMSEGMPNAMLEALGVDLPCIGSNIPGIRDILQYEELVFDPQDEMALLEKLRQVFSDQRFFDQVKRLCQERKKVLSFDWSERLFEMVTAGFSRLHERPWNRDSDDRKGAL
jgi:glycosyltransferase involved in cell wall biosynthesis